MTEIILTSSVLILLLVIFRRAMRSRISPGVQYALWLLVALRLLIPGTLFAAPVSVVGAAAELQTTVRQSFPETFPDPGASDSSPAAGLAGQLPENPLPVADPVDITDIREAEISRRLEANVRNWTSRNWPDLIWKTGIAVTGGAMVISNLIFHFRLRKSRKHLHLPAVPWSGSLCVYQLNGLPSPCLFGFLRPAVYLNEAAMYAEHPEHVLVHEYVHYRHGDHLWAILRSVCVAVHWYNPLVWLAASLSKRDCELACDAAVLKTLGEGEQIEYGQTLLSMVSKDRHPAALLRTATTMTAGKRAMKERIALIVKQPRMRKITLLLVTLLACLLAACTFGGKAELEPAGTPANPGDIAEIPIAVVVGQSASSNSNDYSRITDTDEVKRLWELYQSFEYEGAYDPTGKGGWPILVSFQFSDEPRDDTDISFILFQHGVHTLDGEDLLLKNIDEIYTEFYRMSTSNPITPNSGEVDVEVKIDPTSPADLDPGGEIMAENARSIIEHIQNGSDVGEWLPLMNYMNWQIIYKAMVNTGEFNDEDLDPILSVMDEIEQYINRQFSSMTPAEYLYVLTATEGLDGAYAERYAYLVYQMYEANPSQFAYVVLNMLPEPQQTAVLHFFRSEWYYHSDSDSPDMPAMEEVLAHLEETQGDSIFAAPSEMALASPGSTFQFQVFNVSGIYALTYESSDPDVAAVDRDGVVTAVGPGAAVITAHLESEGGVRDFTCAVYCDWDANALPEPAPEELNAPPADIAQYSDIIMGWQRSAGPIMGEAEAVPDQELIYDDLTEDGLRNAVVHSLEQYVRNNIFTHSFGDAPNRLSLDHVELESEPRLAAGQTDLTVNYHYVCKAALDLPNGQPYTAKLAGPTRSTTFSTATQINTLGSMLANGAMGNLNGTAGNLSDLPGELTNQWQRGFFGFVFALPAMPPQTLDATDDNLQTALSMLNSYYQDYIARNGASQYNDRFSRIIFINAPTESTASSIKMEVHYQVECLRDREYGGKTYTLAPQAGDELKTTFTFTKASDTAARDDAAAAQFDQWAQHYVDIVSAAPDGAITYDSRVTAEDLYPYTTGDPNMTLYRRVFEYLYPYAEEQFSGDFAANCYDHEVQLAFHVPNEVTTPQLTIHYNITVTAATRLPSGEIHSVTLTSRELAATLAVTDTAS